MTKKGLMSNFETIDDSTASQTAVKFQSNKVNIQV